MNHALTVGVRERPGHLAEDAGRVVRLERAVPPHAGAQRFAVHERHDEEDELTEFFHRMDGNDVGVRQLRRCTRLSHEPLTRRGVLYALGWQ